MTLADLINEIPDTAAHSEAVSAVLEYVADSVPKSRKDYKAIVSELSSAGKGLISCLESYAASGVPKKIRKKLGVRAGNQKRLSRKIRKLGIEMLVFQLATGIEALEQVTFSGDGTVPGYNSLRNLAFTLSGKPKRTATQAGDYFRQLAEESRLPLLTRKHRIYVEKLTPEYARKTPAKALRKEIRTGKGHSIEPNTPTYSALLHAVVRKARGSTALKRELAKKLEGFENYF